jgi:rRNA maturation endonuclease Nob1
MNLTRHLFCPICGARVESQTDGEFPEVHQLPDHEPTGNANPNVLAVANLCAGSLVTVTLSLMACQACGAKISKHPAGLCLRCFGEAGSEGKANE